MKQVFANDMVAHVWAQQTQESGRSHNGNFSFTGPTLYSYATPIARIVLGANGQRVALLTSKTYSITTTAKHVHPARRAVRHDMPAFTVPFIGERRGRNQVDSEDEAEMHAGNMAHFAARYAERIAKMMKAREWHNPASELHSLYGVEREYALCFGLAEPERATDVDVQPVLARFTRLRAAENDPAAVAKREKERARREARKAEKMVALQAEARVAFRAGNWHSALRALPVMLRVDGDEIVTSHGARFPVEHGKRAFKAIAAIKASGRGWETNGHTIPLGHFKVDRVSPDGEVRAGCHVVAWAEVEHCAASLGLVE